MSETTTDEATTEVRQLPAPLAVIDAVNRDPSKPALITAERTVTFSELRDRMFKLAQALRASGVQTGDAIGLVCSNRPEFVETYLASLYAGLRLTPINWHLTGEEIAYILDNCEAKALVGDARFAGNLADAIRRTPGLTLRLAVGGDIDGFEPYEDALAAQPAETIEDPSAGSTMLYTSGTTGRPKGVRRRRPARPRAGGRTATSAVPAEPETDVHLCTGPLYHAAPLAFSLALPMSWGVPVVLMDGWDAAATLRLIDEHRITHVHMVPTMFHRLLALPEDEKASFDGSSLRQILHGAAPCPVHVKQALIDWVGPIVYEYYAATEGGAASIGPEEWLSKPGSVGKPPEDHVEIRDDDGELVATGEVGTIYIRAPEEAEERFEYYKDSEKTSSAYRDTHFTLGDMGYFDDDGYLYLTDRSADLIISGGVNIYPAEVDAVLLTHPAVGDACTIGVPNREWGEEVKSVIELKDGLEPSDGLSEELLVYCRERLAHYKCPRSVDFDILPRHETGKLYRRLVRDRYRQTQEVRDGDL